MRWSPERFVDLSLDEQVRLLYRQATFVTSIRYYRFKVNLYLLEDFYVEVFVNHKRAEIAKAVPLDCNHTRMKFYCDQIRLSLN